MFPESFTFSIADWVNGWVDSLVTNYGDVFRHISDTLLWAIVNLESLLRAALMGEGGEFAFQVPEHDLRLGQHVRFARRGDRFELV